MRSFIFVPVIVLLLAGSCGTSRNSTTTTNESSAVTQPESVPSAAQQAENEEIMRAEQAKASGVCRVMVSLISIGEGVDPKAHDLMDAIYNGWKDQGVQVDVEAIPWGREGEVDYCFKFRDLADAEQAVYIDEMKKAFDGNTLVQITENEASRHRK